MTATSTREARQPASRRQRQRLTLLAMCLATFMIQLDVTIVNVALPAIQRGLHTTPGGLEWIISGYALALAALIPLGGALGDRWGRKRIFLIGLAVFAIGSGGCALSGSEMALIVFRVVQGVGGAAMLALTLAIITDSYPAERRAGAIGTWAAIGGTGFGVGPVVGGVLLSISGWQSVFWVNLPFAVAAIALTMVTVAESRNLDSAGFDLLGVALSSAGLVGVTLGLVEAASHPWSSPWVAGSLATGVVLLAAFAIWQRRAPHPMIPPTLMGARSFVSACGVNLISYTAFSGVLFYVTLLYQDVNGWSPLQTGLSWLFMNIPFLLMAQLTGLLDRRFAPSTIVAFGCVAAAAGLLLLSRAGVNTTFVVTAIGYLLAGAGFGTLVPGVAHVAMRDVAAGVSGGASGIVNASRQLGTSIGLAVLGSIGIAAAGARWHTEIAGLGSRAKELAAGQTQDVATAHLGAVVRVFGSSYRHPAAESFVYGYQLAVGIGGACLLAAAVIAVVGFRRTRNSDR